MRVEKYEDFILIPQRERALRTGEAIAAACVSEARLCRAERPGYGAWSPILDHTNDITALQN